MILVSFSGLSGFGPAGRCCVFRFSETRFAHFKQVPVELSEPVRHLSAGKSVVLRCVIGRKCRGVRPLSSQNLSQDFISGIWSEVSLVSGRTRVDIIDEAEISIGFSVGNRLTTPESPVISPLSSHPVPSRNTSPRQHNLIRMSNHLVLFRNTEQVFQ